MCSALRYIERISTRVSGQRSTMRRVASTPSSSGIAMSMMTTSGRRRCASATASRPFPATPITCRSWPPSSKARRPSRTTAWSSASITVTGMSSSRSDMVLDEHLHAGVGFGVKGETGPDGLGPLAHDQQPPAGAVVRCADSPRIEAHAVVAHRQGGKSVYTLDRDLHVIGVRMLGDVVERLLRDPEHRKIDRLGQFRGRGVSPESHLDA